MSELLYTDYHIQTRGMELLNTLTVLLAMEDELNLTHAERNRLLYAERLIADELKRLLAPAPKNIGDIPF